MGLKQNGNPMPLELVTSFRRTLVGLKHHSLHDNARVSGGFQTDPRGVEAVVGLEGESLRLSFRRTLVGLKLGP